MLIFGVHLSPIDQIPDVLGDLVTYRFWVEDHGMSRTLGDPAPDPTERAYYDGLRRLARDLAATLTDSIQPRAERANGFTVFLNGGRDDLDLVRRTAARLAQRGLSCVLPVTADGEPASEPAAIRRDLNDNLEVHEGFQSDGRDAAIAWLVGRA